MGDSGRVLWRWREGMQLKLTLARELGVVHAKLPAGAFAFAAFAAFVVCRGVGTGKVGLGRAPTSCEAHPFIHSSHPRGNSNGNPSTGRAPARGGSMLPLLRPLLLALASTDPAQRSALAAVNIRPVPSVRAARAVDLVDPAWERLPVRRGAAA